MKLVYDLPPAPLGDKGVCKVVELPTKVTWLILGSAVEIALEAQYTCPKRANPYRPEAKKGNRFFIIDKLD